MNTNQWHSLVVETQFATELARTGLRRLCSVPTGPEIGLWGSVDLNFSLHVGMYSYASGLERLCKLAIACSSYASTGAFPDLRGYSHKIGKLLDAVGKIDMPKVPIAPRQQGYLAERVELLDPDLTKMVERFANGPGRYEHLDLLFNENAEVTTYDDWSKLAGRSSKSDQVSKLISLKRQSASAIGTVLIDNELESAGRFVVEDLEVPVYEPSVSVALGLFRKIRRVATVLDVSTSNTHPDLPILGEVVARVFLHSSVDFYQYHIARISDEVVVNEELRALYERKLEEDQN